MGAFPYGREESHQRPSKAFARRKSRGQGNKGIISIRLSYKIKENRRMARFPESKEKGRDIQVLGTAAVMITPVLGKVRGQKV